MVVGTRALGRAALLAATLLGAVSAGLGADDLLYYVEGGEVVFTNLPQSGTKPVPGMRKSWSVHAGQPLPSTRYDPFIERVATEMSIDPALIKAVALVESGFNPRAVSPKGAQGLMQLMPATARSYGVSDPHDPYQNLRAGAQHLRSLLDEFDGDLTLALAAYNAGSGAVRRHGGVPRYRETQDYVRKVEGHLSGGQRRRAARPSAPTVSRAPITLRQATDGSVLFAN
jgi:hypothetical protein